ncbi:hypothetical protein [Arcticibacter eurypsychrophilus]|uniref:hypothetical protein n=1 Tax=Arcticibacter eurypsychrophilus TaxID=1434752 RepID=UPI00084D9D39|nr:hypothetical protein [Arcticibacter eurypsychrophilus]
MRSLFQNTVFLISAIAVTVTTSCLVALILYPLTSLVVFIVAAIFFKFFINSSHLTFFEEEYSPDISAKEFQNEKQTVDFKVPERTHPI